MDYMRFTAKIKDSVPCCPKCKSDQVASKGDDAQCNAFGCGWKGAVAELGLDERYDVVDQFTGDVRHKDVSGDTAQSAIDRLNEEFKEASDLADRIARFVNRSGSEQGDQFVAAMGRQHRTLAQGFTGLCCAWFEHLAKLHDLGPGYYDLRNEASVKLAKAITETKQWQDMHFLPYI